MNGIQKKKKKIPTKMILLKDNQAFDNYFKSNLSTLNLNLKS